MAMFDFIHLLSTVILLIFIILIISHYVKDKSLTYLFYDIGVISNHNDNYVSGVEDNYTPDGKILTNNTSGIRYYLCNTGNSSASVDDTYDFQSPFKIEFEVLELSGEVSFYCANDGSPTVTAHQSISIGKFLKPINIAGNCSIGFKVKGNSSIKFKNLIVTAQ